MSEKKNIGRDSLLLTITQFTTLGISMITTMLLSRFRTLEEYGTYSQIMMVSMIVITFFVGGFSQCINYFLGKSNSSEEKERFIKNYYSIVSLIGVLAGVVMLLLMPIIKWYFGNENLTDFWFVLLLYPISNILISGLDRFFIAYKRVKWLIIYKCGHSLSVLCCVVLTLAMRFDFYHYMMLYTFIEIFFGLSVYVWIHKLTNIVPIGIQKSCVFEIFKFAIPLAFASLVSTINTEMDKLIVGGIVDVETLAIYTNAAKELPIHIIATSVSSVVMPYVVRNTTQNNYGAAAGLWKKSIVLSYIFICFFVTALFVFAPQVIDVLYSEKYMAGVNVFRIYSLVLLFRVTYYGMMLNALGKTSIILKASVVTMISNLILDVVLYKIVGITGPAIATFLSVGIMNIYQLLLTKKITKLRFDVIYPVKDMFFITCVNVILGVAVYVIHKLLCQNITMNQIIATIILGIVWFIIYIFIQKKKIISIWKELNTGEKTND